MKLKYCDTIGDFLKQQIEKATKLLPEYKDQNLDTYKHLYQFHIVKDSQILKNIDFSDTFKKSNEFNELKNKYIKSADQK